MNLFNALKNTVIALILFAIISGEALAENPSVFESYNLRYGITVNLPRHWRILEKQLMDSINTNTEIITGTGQGNNDIVIAANYYENNSGDPLATARISVRTKKTATQRDIDAMTQSDLDNLADQDYKKSLDVFNKSENRTMRMTRYKMTKDMISGYIAIRSDYQRIAPNRAMNDTIYMICLGDRIVKVTLTCNAERASLLAPTINEIKRSIRIIK